MEQLPKQIIIGEKEFVDSIYKFDYHPAFRKVLEDNDCKVCTIQEFKKSYRIMDNTPLRISPNENILFILDPHSNGLYINSTKDDIEQKMCTNKCIAYKEVLISMGAKEIKLVNTSSDELKTSKDSGQSHLDLSEILEKIFKRLKINDVFLCSYSLHFVYLYLISSD
ncbi:hypothetical protein, partial [Porphyromonas gingivalis]|uniref:hypothetical protein n=1 Tax=Porphyromonas gingivalis TaxID=837 RepID=UPI000BE71693